MTAPAPKKGPVIPIALALAAITFLVFLPVRHYEFLNWDDLTYVVENDHVRGGLTWDGIAWAFTQSHSANWHPLTWISHAADCQFFGLNAGAHHLVNVAFHAANALLLFVFLRLVTGSLWRSAFAAALFALHPLHVESVAWLAERKDVLSTFFFLLTLLAYAKYVSGARGQVSGEAGHASRITHHGDASKAQSSKSTVWYGAALLLFALGLMSKPMLVTTPFVLLLLDYWPLGRVSGARGQVSGKDEEHSTFNIQHSTSNETPDRLTAGSGMDHASRITHQASRFTLLPLIREKLPFFALTIASCVVTLLAQRKGGAVASFESLPLGYRIENAAVACVQYLAKLFWPASLSPIYPHPERWAWWLVAGSVALLAAVTAAAWLGRRRFPCALAGWLWFLVTLAPVIGIVQVGSQAFADRYTYIPLIGIMIALVWLWAEVVLTLERWRTGRGLDEQGASSPRPSPPLPGGEGVVAASRRHACSSVVGCIFAFILPLAILVVLTWRTTEQLVYWKNTETLFRRALVLAPNNPQAMFGLGSHLVNAGQSEEGLPLLEQVIRAQPGLVEALGTLASALESQGRYEQAIRRYREALAAQPNQAGVLNNLAWLKASCPDPAFRDGAEAVRLATRACELTGYSKPLFIGTLAAAQAETGNFQAAIATAERAAALATALGLDDTAARNRELIGLYHSGKAAHSSPPKIQ